MGQTHPLLLPQEPATRVALGLHQLCLSNPLPCDELGSRGPLESGPCISSVTRKCNVWTPSTSWIFLFEAMAARKVVVVGGGVTGLSIAHRLITKGQGKIQVTVLEASERLGGWVKSTRENGVLFEDGPRSLRVGGNGASTLNLIGELGIQDSIVPASLKSNVRYLWLNGKRQALPSSLGSAISNEFTPDFALSVLREPMKRRGAGQDESLHSFFTRRFGFFVADKVITAMVSGVWAGDARKLSVKSCMKGIYDMEARSGSVLLDAFYSMFRKKSPSPQPPPPSHVTAMLQGAGVYSFREGIQTLTDALHKRIAPSCSIRMKARVASLAPQKDGLVKVVLEGGEEIEAHHVFSSVDSQTLSKLISKVDSESSRRLASIENTSLAVIGVTFPPPATQSSPSPATKEGKAGGMGGFGHLVVQGESDDALGVVYDSDVFPDQGQGERRLTVMAGGATRGGDAFLASHTDDELRAMAERAVRDQTGITDAPSTVRVVRAQQAIAQYNVGHSEARDRARELLGESAKWLSFAGAAFDGVGVNDCVMHGRRAADSYIANEFVAGRL